MVDESHLERITAVLNAIDTSDVPHADFLVQTIHAALRTSDTKQQQEYLHAVFALTNDGYGIVREAAWFVADVLVKILHVVPDSPPEWILRALIDVDITEGSPFSQRAYAIIETAYPILKNLLNRPLSSYRLLAAQVIKAFVYDPHRTAHDLIQMIEQENDESLQYQFLMCLLDLVQHYQYIDATDQTLEFPIDRLNHLLKASTRHIQLTTEFIYLLVLRERTPRTMVDDLRAASQNLVWNPDPAHHILGQINYYVHYMPSRKIGPGWLYTWPYPGTD